MTSKFMYWNDLYGKPVLPVGQGRQCGVVEDFYYDPETQAIYALRVNAGLHGHRVLLSSSISSIDQSGVMIANEFKLIDEDNAGPIYQLPLGDRLTGFRIVTEEGQSLGSVRNIVLGIYPPTALRISAFELDDRQATRVSAHEITHFGEDSLTVMEQEGKKVR